MNRRSFTQRALIGLSSLSALSWTSSSSKTIIRPPRLQKGDQIGLITPASYIDDEGLEEAVNNLEKLGLKVVKGKHLRAQYGSMAGTDAERLADLHSMFANPDIKGIWCARGGYGAARLLEHIDYELIRQNPKVLVGYSDITALHCAIWEKTGLVTFHGPVGNSTLTDYTLEQVQSILFNPQETHKITISEAQLSEVLSDDAYKPGSIVPGQAEGELIGGNLSLLASLAGTAYLPDVKGKLVFIEDIGEKPYRIDRMLTTLHQAWPLRDAAGIALGVFTDCEASSGSRSLSLQETLRDRLGNLGIPVYYGISFGHVDNMTTLPVGVRAQLDATEGLLTLMSSGVQ